MFIDLGNIILETKNVNENKAVEEIEKEFRLSLKGTRVGLSEYQKNL